MYKRQSELTQEDTDSYEWMVTTEWINDNGIPIAVVDKDPLMVRGLKKFDPGPAPEGKQWVDVTSLSDAVRNYILVDIPKGSND